MAFLESGICYNNYGQQQNCENGSAAVFLYTLY